MNTLNHGDKLKSLRDYTKDEGVDPVHLGCRAGGPVGRGLLTSIRGMFSYSPDKLSMIRGMPARVRGMLIRILETLAIIP